VILVVYDAVHMGQQQVTSERQQYGEEFHHHSRADKNRWREELEQRFPGAIAGVLSCYDRVLLQGTLPGICFAGGMEKFLRTQGILLKDYTQWALPLAGQLKARAASLAAEAGISIEFLRKKVRKENRVQEVLAQRGNHPGLVCVFSALERCDTYRLHKNRDGRWGLRPDSGKCLHYYFYFMDPRWDSAFCGCRPGLLSGCSFILTVTTGWRGYWSGRKSAIDCWTMRSSTSPIGSEHKRLPIACGSRNCTATWIAGRLTFARCWPPLGGVITGA
jgi:hypothetical protein